MEDDSDAKLCPLCVEEIDQTDKNFLPCPCGYQVSFIGFLNELYILIDLVFL
jgi:hypothetical protein